MKKNATHEKIIKMVKEGVKYKVIADKFGITSSAVGNIARRYGVYRNVSSQDPEYKKYPGGSKHDPEWREYFSEEWIKATRKIRGI